MTDHFPNKQIEAFYARTLEVSEMVAIAEHLASCDGCHQKFHEIFQRERGCKPISISLSAEDWFRDEHLDYDQLVSLVEDKLDAEEFEIVNIHLEVCEHCREDVRNFIEFRKKLSRSLMLDLHLIKNNLNAAINSEIATTHNVRLLKSLYNLFCRCLLHFMPRYKHTVFTGDYREVSANELDRGPALSSPFAVSIRTNEKRNS